MIDLSVLEAAAARAGLPGLRARLMKPRSPWFRVSGGTLRVSECVVERCAPDEAAALLVNAIFCRRARRTSLLVLLVGAVVGARLLFTIPVFLVGAAILWSRATLAADDRTVALLGDPECFVRALNRMNVEELRFGEMHLEARPDLHRRAERLVRRHGLRGP